MKEKDEYWTDFKCPECGGFRFETLNHNMLNGVFTGRGKYKGCNCTWNRDDDSGEMFLKFKKNIDFSEDLFVLKLKDIKSLREDRGKLKRAVELLKEARTDLFNMNYSEELCEDIRDFLKEVEK